MGFTRKRRYADDKTGRKYFLSKTILPQKNDALTNDEKMQIGDNVKFLGYTKEQVLWGNNDTPYMLILDRIYEVVDVDVHRQHTKVQLKGILGKFNSVHFQVVD